MTARRPSKPWRVIVAPALTETKHTSEAKAFEFVRVALGKDSPATSARVEYWEDGRWRWFETMTKEDMA